MNEQDVQDISGRYNLTLVNYESIADGGANTNYLVHTPLGRCVLTVFEEQTFDQVVKLGQLLQLLQAQAYPTPVPLLASNRARVLLYKDKPVMMKAYVEGAVVRNLSVEMLHQAGVALAELHQIPLPDCVSSRAPYGARKLQYLVGHNLDSRYETWLVQQLADYAQHKPIDLPHGLIHGDLFYDNVLFAGQRLQAILDFEEVSCDDLVFDLGMGIVGLCRIGGRVILEKARALVQGYEQVRALEARERRVLQMCVVYAAATVSCWRYWKYHIAEPDETRAVKYRQMVQVAKRIQRIPQDEFSAVVFG
jgi:homoserine kinase type II